jgi:hypothetical protein
MPGNDVADRSAAEHPNLHQLFGGYFHQDWALDHEGWQDVVDLFVAQASAEVVARTAAELDGLLADGLSEDRLASVLAGLDCFADPAAWNMTPGQWLAAVRDRLPAGPDGGAG